MQQRFLVRAPNLAAFRQALADRATAGDLVSIRRRVVIVPTRAAGELLRRSLERRLTTGGAVVCPEWLTRDDLLQRAHHALDGGRRWMSRLEREIVLGGAAEQVLASRRFPSPPFRLRPGLIGAMLDFYDELGRRQRSVRRLARVLFDELRVERGTDRGSDGLIDQTRFLALSFLAYSRAVAASDASDEHLTRRSLLAEQPPLPFREVVVAVADHPADPRGLWPSDFDLIGRLTGIDRVEIVMTDEAHDAGFRSRIEDELPGIEEHRVPAQPWTPVLESTAGLTDPPVFMGRD